MIVGCATYRFGTRLPGTEEPIAAAKAATHDGAFAWVGLLDPTPGELSRCTLGLGLPSDVLAEALQEHQRPVLEVVNDTVVLVLKPARYEPDDALVELGEITVIVAPHAVVTVRHGAFGHVKGAREELEAEPQLLAKGPGAVLLTVTRAVLNDYGSVLRGLRHDIEVLERDVFTPGDDGNPAQAIYLLKREVLDFQQATVSLIDPLEDLADGLVPHVDPSLYQGFAELKDRLARQAARADAYGDLLTSILTAYQTEVALRQNEDMRKISSWVAIAAVPTMIAGVYGMNFDTMPELRWRFGYPLVVGVIAIICVALYRKFRKRGWL